MAKNVAKLIVENWEDAEILDYIDECLKIADRNLDDKEGAPIVFGAGIAVTNVQVARSVLKAYREKKFGEKPVQVF